MTRRIPLVNKLGTVVAEAFVDDADYPELSVYTWRLHIAGYAARWERRNGRKYAVFLHRVILGVAGAPELEGDHINHNKLDNRRCNLRVVTRAENAQNKRASRFGTSKYRGVYWHKRDRRWIARGTLQGHQHDLGRFRDEKEAAKTAASWRADHMPFAVADGQMTA